MLIDLPPNAREPLRPLFKGLPGLHGCLHAVLEGTMGTARTDHAHRPTVALIDLDFSFLAGDPNAPAAEEAVRSLQLPAFLVPSSAQWEPLLQRVWGDAVGTRTRVAFRPGAWDPRRLREFMELLPAGFSLKRITLDDVAQFASLADSLVYNFPSLEEFVERGVGLGVEHEGRFIAGCSSFAASSRSLEFDIQTHPDYRRRGFACAAAAAMIEYCIEQGLEPCWDAQNEMSAALATKLGFVEPAPYTSYEIRAR